MHLFANGSAGKTTDILSFVAAEAQDGSDAVGRVMHWRESGPVAGPSIHILLVAGFEKLEFAEFAIVIEFLHVKELPGVDDRFHHHVVEAGFSAQFDDGLAVFLRGRHRDGASDVLAGFESGDGLFGVVRNRRIDVDRINLGVCEKLFVVSVTFFDSKLVADFIEGGFSALADRRHFGVRVALVNGNEFGTKSEAYDSDTGIFDGSVHAAIKRFNKGVRS